LEENLNDSIKGCFRELLINSGKMGTFILYMRKM
jgi:hypothetical protein